MANSMTELCGFMHLVEAVCKSNSEHFYHKIKKHIRWKHNNHIFHLGRYDRKSFFTSPLMGHTTGLDKQKISAQNCKYFLTNQF